MANETQVTLVGNIGGGDPELRFLPSGVAVCKFRMACTPRRSQDGKWVDGEPSWFQVTAWRGLGENVAESLRNGDRVVVHGNLTVRQYEDKDGNKRTSTEVDAVEIGAAMTFATVAVTKVKRTGGGDTGGGRSTATRADDPWAGTEANAPAGQSAQSPAASW
jgi:single-strand DNA-binding protein